MEIIMIEETSFIKSPTALTISELNGFGSDLKSYQDTFERNLKDDKTYKGIDTKTIGKTMQGQEDTEQLAISKMAKGIVYPLNRIFAYSSDQKNGYKGFSDEKSQWLAMQDLCKKQWNLSDGVFNTMNQCSGLVLSLRDDVMQAWVQEYMDGIDAHNKSRSERAVFKPYKFSSLITFINAKLGRVKKKKKSYSYADVFKHSESGRQMCNPNLSREEQIEHFEKFLDNEIEIKKKNVDAELGTPSELIWNLLDTKSNK